MEERTTLEVIAPTVEEAISQGLAQLGLPAEAVSVEVLDSGGKGFLGLGGRQVRVRLTLNADPETAPASQSESAPASQPKPEAVPAPAAESRPAAENDRLLNMAEEVVSKMLHLMKLEAQVSARYDEPDRNGRQAVYVDVRGKDLSVLIGRRGETVNAFQRIAALIVSKEMEQWVRLVVDVEGHRGRRERQLRQMARRMAEQAVKTGRRQTLEPMPASERRLVHMELHDHPDVETLSVGEDPYRKVTIKPKNS
ncbi:MAG: KH domain-containing protein [Chloroflexi bacterium]|nr:KH domain-containing protein [Chloroflexota bacterium]